MERLTTFEDIFNKLLEEYRGVEVEVVTKQDGLIISCFTTTLNNILIKPLNKKQSKKWSQQGEKIGLLVIEAKKNKNTFNIPFILGYNTMNAVFLSNGATIQTLELEFVIKKISGRIKQLA